MQLATSTTHDIQTLWVGVVVWSKYCLISTCRDQGIRSCHLPSFMCAKTKEKTAKSILNASSHFAFPCQSAVSGKDVVLAVNARDSNMYDCWQQRELFMWLWTGGSSERIENILPELASLLKCAFTNLGFPGKKQIQKCFPSNMTGRKEGLLNWITKWMLLYNIQRSPFLAHFMFSKGWVELL